MLLLSAANRCRHQHTCNTCLTQPPHASSPTERLSWLLGGRHSRLTCCSSGEGPGAGTRALRGVVWWLFNRATSLFQCRRAAFTTSVTLYSCGVGGGRGARTGCGGEAVNVSAERRCRARGEGEQPVSDTVAAARVCMACACWPPPAAWGCRDSRGWPPHALAAPLRAGSGRAAPRGQTWAERVIITDGGAAPSSETSAMHPQAQAGAAAGHRCAGWTGAARASPPAQQAGHAAAGAPPVPGRLTEALVAQPIVVFCLELGESVPALTAEVLLQPAEGNSWGLQAGVRWASVRQLVPRSSLEGGGGGVQGGKPEGRLHSALEIRRLLNELQESGLQLWLVAAAGAEAGGRVPGPCWDACG